MCRRLLRPAGVGLRKCLLGDPGPDLLLDAEELRLEDDVVRPDPADVEEVRDIRPELLREQVVRGPVGERGPDVAVDVRHHQVDVLLGEVVERRRQQVAVALGEDEADALVVALGVRLLAGRSRVAVEEVGDAVALAVELDGPRVAELGAVVGEHHDEHLAHDGEPRVLAELPDEPLADRPEGRGHVRGCLRVEEEGQHERMGHEHEREQHLAALGSLHGVHLRHRKSGIPFDEPVVVGHGPVDAAPRVHLVLDAPALARGEPALARQVPVPGLQEPAVDVAVDGLLADGDHVGVVDDGRVHRLPVRGERVDEPVHRHELLFGDVRPFARLREDCPVVLLRVVRDVEPLHERALRLLRASVADEGRGLQLPALLLDVVRAAGVALAAEAAEHAAVRVKAPHAGGVAPLAVVAVDAAVVDASDRSLQGPDRAVHDLAHDGLRRPAEGLCDPVRRPAVVKHLLDALPFVACETGLLLALDLR